MNRHYTRSRLATTEPGTRMPSPLLQWLSQTKPFFVSPFTWLWDSLLDLWDSIFHKDRAVTLRITRHLRRSLDKYVGAKLGTDTEAAVKLQTYLVLKRMLPDTSDAKHILFKLEQTGSTMSLVPANLFTLVLMFGNRVRFSDVDGKERYDTPTGSFSFINGKPSFIYPKQLRFVNVSINQ